MNKIYIVKMGQGSICGTCLQGEIDISYETLVKIFGPPNSDGDGYKVDAEWFGTINDLPFTIYNYKTGKNYNGEDGLETEKIKDWHIGGNANIVANMVEKYIENFPAKLKN